VAPHLLKGEDNLAARTPLEVLMWVAVIPSLPGPGFLRKNLEKTIDPAV